MAKKDKNSEDLNLENEAAQAAEQAAEANTETGEQVTEGDDFQRKWEEANEHNLRLLAEFDNFRKRSRREMDGLREYASENVLIALLPVLDDFDRTLTVMEKTDNLASIKDGIRLVTEKLHKTLEKEGLNPIKAAGTPFDSGLHEAIHSVEVEGAKKGLVLEEVEKGYRLKDKVIRYSKVVVGE